MRNCRITLILVIVCALFTADLSAQLARQWIARFSGTKKNAANAATAMTIDQWGNVIVTGWVTNNSSGVDITTVKYSPDGEKLWEATYTSSGGAEDKPKAIAVDRRNHVYVTGSTVESSGGLNIVTIHYDSTLQEQQVTKYNGVGSGEDQPSAIAVNDSLNVYVTGWSYGGTGTGFDYVTIKYDSVLSQKWVKSYNGPSNGTDSALALSLRGTSDLFVTGSSRTYVDSGYDYFTIRYSAATGDSIWGSRYTGQGTDIARAIYARTSSEVYVTGSSQNANGDFDYLTMRLNATGGVQWMSRYNGTANGDDHAYALVTLSTSRLFVTGSSLQPGSYTDAVTVRYNMSNGDQSWDPPASYNGSANDDDVGVALISGNGPYLLVSSQGLGVGRDYVVVKYASGGSEDYSMRYNSSSYNDDDVPVALEEDGGAVYVTGMSKTKKGSEWLTIKYVDPDRIKYRTFVQESLAVKAAKLKTASTVPNAGNVRDEAVLKAYPKIKRGYAGYPGGLVLGNARRDSASVYGWIRFDKGSGIAKFVPATGPASWFDSIGGVPFVGEKKNPKLDKYNNHLAGELVTLKINIGASDAEITPQTLGDLVYHDGDTSNHFNGLTLREIALRVDNFLTYGGKYPIVDGKPLDSTLVRLDSILSRVNRAFVGPPGPLPYTSKIPLFVPGVNPADSVWYLQPAIAPMLDPLAFDRNSLVEEPVSYALHQNYPNPFNPTTTIGFDLPEQSLVTLKVYDLLGRDVAMLLDNELMDEGSQELIFDASALASGVYFYRILVNDGLFQQVRRMIVLK